MANAIAVIPARGGSKGVARKNLALVAGKPLVAWTIEAAKACPTIERVIVSSDDADILAIAQAYGVEALERPAALSGDTVRSEPVLVHALEQSALQKALPEWAVYLQPTSPLRTAGHIARALELLEESDADCLISVCETDNKVLKSYLKTGEGYLTGIANNDYPNWNRQDLPDVYMPNGAIYIVRTKLFLEQPRFWNERTVPFVMQPEESIDIDTPESIVRAETLLKNS